MLRYGLNGHRTPGLGSTFTDAQAIADALERDPNGEGFERAFAILANYVGGDLQLVANKAIALGARPDLIKIMLDSLGGETIEVVGTAPSSTAVKVGKLALGAAIVAGLGAGLVAYSRRGA